MSIEFVLLIFLFLAVVFDLKKRRVPNLLVLAGYGAGVAGLGIQHGIRGAVSGVFLAAAALACFMPLYIAGMLGGGDCKVLSWIALFAGRASPDCYLYVLVCAGFAALFVRFILGKRTFCFTVPVFAGAVLWSIFKTGGMV